MKRPNEKLHEGSADIGKNAARTGVIILAVSVSFFLSGHPLRCSSADDAATPPAWEAEATGETTVESLPQQLRLRGGLCVLIGDAMPLEQALRLLEDGPWVIHWLHSDKAWVEDARKKLQQRGRYGAITVEHWEDANLPYADNLANLIISAGRGAPPAGRDELLRVIAPDSPVYIEEGADVTRLKAPRPAEMGQWTHPWHDAGGSPASTDSAVGAVNAFQWIAGPPFPMGHRKNSSGVILSAGGRVFYITANVFENLPGGGHPPNYLTARDAFSGVTLWSRPWEGPLQNQRHGMHKAVVASEDRIYGAREGGIAVLDAATGSAVGTFPARGTPGKLLLIDGMLVAQTESGLAAFDIGDGSEQWHSEMQEPWGAVSGEGRVFCLTSRRGEDGQWHHTVHALDLKSGEKLWERPAGEKTGHRLTAGLRLNFAGAGVLSLIERHELRFLSVDDGKQLWHYRPGTEPRGGHDPRFVGHFLIDGRLWMRLPDRWTAYNPLTGEAVGKEIEVPGTGGNACQPVIASRRFIIPGRRSKMWDMETGREISLNFIRSACQMGLAVANSMLYIPPNACGCLAEQLRGNLALVYSGDEGLTSIRPAELQRGPAYGETEPAGEGPDESEWPMYRRDGRRSAYLPQHIKPELGNLWRTALAEVKRPRAEGYTRELETPSEWLLRKDPDNIGVESQWFAVEEPDEKWRSIPVPSHYHSTWAGQYHGFAWYHAAIGIPEDITGDMMIIDFEGVDEQAWVFFNGVLVYEHTEEATGKSAGVLWETPFSAEVPGELIRIGEENYLAVRVHTKAYAGGIYEPVSFRVFEREEADEPARGVNGRLRRDGHIWEWHLNYGRILTPPATAGGLVLLAEPQTHQVIALDESSGDELWRFTAGGRVTTPPGIHAGLALVGAHDGYVYALRPADGKLVWRRRAAPSDRRIMAYGQIESAWPVTNVMVHKDLALAVAGRAADAGGGAILHAFEPESGRVKWSRRIKPNSARHGKPDLPVTDGEHVYLMNKRLDTETGEVSEIEFRTRSFTRRIDGEHRDGNRVRRAGYPEGVRYLRSGQAGFMQTSWTELSIGLRKSQSSWTWGESEGELLAFTDKTGYAFHIDGGANMRNIPRVHRGGGWIEAKDAGTQGIKWHHVIDAPAQVEAMLITNGVLFAAGLADRSDPAGPGFLRAIDSEDGRKLGGIGLPAGPVHDGIAAAGGRVFAVLKDGSVMCLEAQ